MTDPWKNLAAEVLDRACKKAMGQSEESQSCRAWLLSDDAKPFTEILDMDVTIPEWVRQGCPKPDGRMPRSDRKSRRDYSRQPDGEKG
jgi:hypothetical protein